MEAYGSRTPLKSLAQVAVRDGRNLFITTFDTNLGPAVEKAVRKAGMNLNPVSEGAGRLRVPIAKPSAESRLALKEQVNKEAEAAKVATRMVRRKAMDDVKALKDEVSKDETKRLEKCVQTMTDLWIERIGAAQRAKSDAVMDVSLSVRK